MSGLKIIIEEIEERIKTGREDGCSGERIAELKSLLSFAKSLSTVPEVKNGLEWCSNKEEPEEDRQVLVCIAGFYYVDFYHKKDKRFYMFEKPKHFLHEIDKWIYLDKLDKNSK